MRLIGREKLCCINHTGERVKKWVLSWAAEVANANWKHPADVHAQFPNMRQDEGVGFLFPVNGSTWVICMLIAFPQGVALITALKAKDEIYEN